MEHTTLNSRNWALLLNAVEEGRVVPIIGDALLSVNENGKLMSINEYLIKKLSERFCHGESVGQLADILPYIDSYNRKTASSNIGETTDIYYEIYEILSAVKVELCKTAKEMVTTCRFPLILTTSYIKNLDAQLAIPSHNVCVYNKSMASDISGSVYGTSQQILYYLFGRLSMAKRSFVATEEDLLDYMHYWHNTETRPTRLTGYLSDKFFLVLGCSYPDWLFRFFWHSVKNFTVKPSTMDVQGIVSLESHYDDKQLMQFLSRVQTSVCEKAEEFMTELTDKFAKIHNSDATSYSSQSLNAPNNQLVPPEVFISYASEDKDLALAVYEDFCKVAGKEAVWFDEPQLEAGDAYENLIMRKIEQCKRFVPIITHNTLQPGRRFFKKEWTKAREEAGFHGDEVFITPIIVDDTSRDDERIPSDFRKVHILDYHFDDFELEVRKIVRSYR